MKVMVIVKATKDSEAGVLPSQELLAAMGAYNEQLVKAGIMLDGDGLQPSSKGARVRFSGKDRTVIDGPFAETKELIAGYWVWRVKDLAEAIEWVKRCPNPMNEDSDIEIRPYFEADDFGEAFTPELREQEASLRAVNLGLNKPQFRDAPERLIAGVNQAYTKATCSAIPQQWERFVSQPANLPGHKGPDFYGVSWNMQPNCAFDYLTGVEVTDVSRLPAGMTSVQLPAGRYAVFAHTGHVSAIGQTIDTLWSQWAPDCGLKLAQTPSFERYTAEFDARTGLGGMELWVPLAR